MLNPIILYCQSNPNPSHKCDLQSKSDFQNGLTIQSTLNHNTMNVNHNPIYQIELQSGLSNPVNPANTVYEDDSRLPSLMSPYSRLPATFECYLKGLYTKNVLLHTIESVFLFATEA